jgi:polysaccharide chain length determinant protein (PEP-CTERM system associated)
VQTLLRELIEHVRSAWRFRAIALWSAWGIAIVAWASIMWIPDTYQASSRIFVDARTTLTEVTRGITVETSVDTQIQKVRQSLIGGPLLERIAADTGLLDKAKTPRDRQDVLEALRNRIDIAGNSNQQGAGAGTFLITYRHRNRETSLRVVEELVESFVSGAQGGKRAGTEQAQVFLRTQLADLESRLTASENRLAEFKKRNVGLMPGAQGDYFSRLQNEMFELQRVQANLNVAARKRDELSRLLNGQDQFIASASTVVAGANPGMTLSDSSVRIRETQARLDDLLLRFTDKHPDVVAARATLAELELRQQQEIEAARRGDSGAAGRAGLNMNPVFQSTQVQRNQADVEVAALQADIADRQRRIGELKALVDTAPEVEAEFAHLNRDYDVTRAQYQQLLERLERTKLSEHAEETGAVHFEVLEPPFVGLNPVGPKRPLLIVMALIAALGIGGALAYLLHLLKPVFSNQRQLGAVAGLPVLGAVSMTWVDKFRLSERRALIASAASLFALFASAAMLAVLNGRIAQTLRNVLT